MHLGSLGEHGARLDRAIATCSVVDQVVDLTSLPFDSEETWRKGAQDKLSS